ncbi:MAG TPA: phosphoribosylformylglycinamidine synthase subunit PurL [Chthoniobacterales bacterium]
MTNDPAITPELIEKHGITPDEYRRIQEILGRDPNFTELGVFSVMWSEHCSYKNSKPELRKFPVSGSRVLVKAGEENAGVIDIGDGWGVAFKMESHNHPSAVEPFQGAATGVGGIIRDIFTMGARPVFSLNSLRFGPLTEARNRQLFSGVVSGISHYGNCIGVPTIGGEVYFDESYNGNPLVNVFCLGVLRHEQIARGAAHGVGNPVFYVGAETGRDGLAGAAFASRDLTEESKQDRPAVQVGDPFKEKLLLEACLELLASGCVAGIQDMGAAGLTCSTCETASRGGTGVEIDLALVPKRETGMTPYEILLSESQERMLIIVKLGEEEAVKRIFEKWDLPYAHVGYVRDDGMMRVKNDGETVVEIPASKLADDAPIYHRETRPRLLPDPIDPETIPPTDILDALPTLLSHPSIASKQWVWRQYDHMVRNGNVVRPGSDAAVFLIREANKLIAATSDCNAIYCALDPREGGKIAVAEAARNLACSGAIPLAVTDNLNFGNPHNPENFWQLQQCVEGLAEACRAFDTPVTGGNVSLYNQSPAGAIDPTPTVGMVGIIESEKHVTTQFFKDEGDVILLLGKPGNEMGGSHFLNVIYGRKEGLPPRVDLVEEKAIHDALRALIRMGLVKSAHDCSEGGLAVALAEAGFERKLGAAVSFADVPDFNKWDEIALFNESQGRVVLTVGKANSAAAQSLLEWRGVPVYRLGTVAGDTLKITTATGKTYEWPVADLYAAWSESIPAAMEP